MKVKLEDKDILDIIKMWKSIIAGYHVFMLSQKVLITTSLLHPPTSLAEARIVLNWCPFNK